MFGKLGMGELLVILVIVLVIFGPSKLPSLAKSMGQAVRVFRKETSAFTKEVEKMSEDVEKMSEEVDANDEEKNK